MIAAGILALEREDPDYEPEFVVEYRQKVVIPKIEQYQSEKKLAEGFNPYSDVPKELESDGWAFMGLIEGTNLPNRELVHGLLDAWVEEWRRMNLFKSSERSIIADITALLPGLSEDGLRRVQAEVNIALSVHNRKFP